MSLRPLAHWQQVRSARAAPAGGMARAADAQRFKAVTISASVSGGSASGDKKVSFFAASDCLRPEGWNRLDPEVLPRQERGGRLVAEPVGQRLRRARDVSEQPRQIALHGRCLLGDESTGRRMVCGTSRGRGTREIRRIV